MILCAGGGGVGKTTAAAAIGLALSRAGKRTLVVTVDPARRLAQALGIELGSEVATVSVDPSTGDRLLALMPEPSSAVRLCLAYVFEPEPEAHDRVRANPLYLALEDGIAGVHELLSVVLVARHAEHAELDAIVIDTAPSRHALDFVTYPGRLAFLLEGRPMAWLAGRAGKGDGRGLLAWGKRRAEAAFDRLLGTRLRADLAQIFVDLALVRERFAAVTRRAESLLLGDQTRFVLVAAPTGAALADVIYLANRLQKLGRAPAALILNRADPAGSSWAKSILESPSATDAMRNAAGVLEQERAGRTSRGDRFARDVKRKLSAPIVRLSNVDAPSPVDVVRGLADQIAPELSIVTGVGRPENR